MVHDIDANALLNSWGPAIITGLFALLAIWLGGRKTRREIGRRVGTPNGHGNVVQMVERLLAGQAGQDERLAKLERGQNRAATRAGRIESRLKALEESAP